MAFPVRMISEKADYIEIDLTTVENYAEFSDYMNLVAIETTVDCFARFNTPDAKPFKFLAGRTYNYFFPIKRIYAWTDTGEEGKLYAWGEKV